MCVLGVWVCGLWGCAGLMSELSLAICPTPTPLPWLICIFQPRICPPSEEKLSVCVCNTLINFLIFLGYSNSGRGTPNRVQQPAAMPSKTNRHFHPPEREVCVRGEVPSGSRPEPIPPKSFLPNEERACCFRWQSESLAAHLKNIFLATCLVFCQFNAAAAVAAVAAFAAGLVGRARNSNLKCLQVLYGEAAASCA